MGLTLDEMGEISEGMIMDMLIESGNDSATYNTLATQADFDNF